MDCKSLLEVIPITELVSVIDGRRVTFGEASRVAMELPNCALEKRVVGVRLAKSVDCNSHIEIHLEEQK